MNEVQPSFTSVPTTSSSINTRLYISIGAGALVLVVLVLSYFFGGALLDRFDSTSFYWSGQTTAASSTAFSGDALLLITKKANPDLPILARVDFKTRTITSLMDLTDSGGGVTSARLAPTGTRIAVTTLDKTGLSKIQLTDAQGTVITSDAQDAGDTNSIRYNVDWSPTNQFMATGVLPTALLGTDKATDVNEWGTYVSSLIAPLQVLIKKSFNPAFSSDGKALFVLSSEGVTAIPVPENSFFTERVASTTSVVATYPDGLKPAAMLFSEDRRTAVVTYLNSDRADVFTVSGDPAFFSPVTTLTLSPVQVPFIGASPLAVSGSYQLEAVQSSGGRVALTLQSASTTAKTLRLPRDVTRVSIVELIGGSLLEK